MDKQYSESEIRDIIAGNLELIESGLMLIDREHYLPNKKGTKGFVDILAKDKNGRLVIIEVKKSVAAAREAIHEILKYLEGVKADKGLKNEEIRLFIISTDWRELVVPFSSLCQNSNINIQGYWIEIKEDKSVSSVRKVEPIHCNAERAFCDHHMLRAYTTKERLQRGIEEHIKAFEEKKIDDYVLIILEAPEGHREKELQAMEVQFSQMGEAFQEHMVSEMREKYPGYDFIIYSAVLLQTEGKYWDIIKTEPYNYEEVLEIIEDYKGEDRIETLHDYAIDVVSPTPTCDTAQIGYAAKLEDYLYNQNWTIQRIIKGNKLDNEFLKNEMILDELLGGEGRTRQKYIKEFDSRNRAGIVSMKKEINYCLQDNKQWRIPIADIVDALLSSIDGELFKGKIYIYNPMHILYTIYLMSANNDIVRWAPNFYIAVEYEEHTTVYFGELKQSGAAMPFYKIVEKYFGDDLFELAFSMTRGGYLYNDLDIVKDLGLTYCMYKVDITKEERKFYEYIDYDFRQCGEVDFLQNTLRYLQTESGVVDDIRNLFENLLPQKGYTIV